MGLFKCLVIYFYFRGLNSVIGLIFAQNDMVRDV